MGCRLHAWESAHDRTCRRPWPRVGLRRWIGNAAEPKGTVRELMHQGHRLAAIGNLRLHEMQTRIKRENLIRRSIDAAPYAPREMNRNFQARSRSRNYVRNLGIKEPAPGKVSTFPSKPRNPNEGFHAHDLVIYPHLAALCKHCEVALLPQ